ncbi:MAG: TlpA disulfide reductase family protein [Planctomycetaceae bacterium]
MSRRFNQRTPQWLMGMLAGICIGIFCPDVHAEDDRTLKDFASIRRQHAQAAFEAVAAYLNEHPDADDAVESYRFLFETALDFDLAREAKGHAEQFLTDHPEASVGDRSQARRLAMLALALEGEADAAIEVFGAELTAIRRLDPSAAIGTATALAAAVQRGNRPEAARQVYERLRRAFLLNAGVEAIVENRLARLELLGKPAPSVELPDLNGRHAAADNLTGRIVLIDFWATNCPPCLAELPQLRRLHADHEEQDFEIIAISLDEEEETVRDYLDRTKLTWRVCLSAADDHATREAYRVETIPANFLVGADGTIVRVDLHGADLRAEVERLLKDER